MKAAFLLPLLLTLKGAWAQKESDDESGSGKGSGKGGSGKGHGKGGDGDSGSSGSGKGSGSSGNSTAAGETNPWTGVGSASFYWHNRYHGLLAMAAYGDYASLCPLTFTTDSLDRQYPGNTETPFEIVGTWGPTPKYQSEGYMVKVPEMNKILAVFKGQYGWQNYNATLTPLPASVGCSNSSEFGVCKAHQGAQEAWAEVKAATNEFEAIKGNQGKLVWSSSGHGFGAMIMQVAAIELKAKGLLFSSHSFGSPPVFNRAAAARWDALFEGDSTQRAVANDDSIPASIPLAEADEDGYAFVSTGIHLFGTNPMYGQDFVVCEGDTTDSRCAGGDSEADHYFYYTDIGSCGTGWEATYNQTFNAEALRSDQRVYAASATVSLPDEPNTSFAKITTTSHSTTSTPPPSPTTTEVSASTPANQESTNRENSAAAVLNVSGGVVGLLIATVMAFLM
ncbi:hypothetical protein BT69DRAFT_1351315 [Atractiella rhizophila]|nr:hypothetical protein BT69DRAFT_1351315 [Atractiella rhizophila]